jgi:hypothetical protein
VDTVLRRPARGAAEFVPAPEDSAEGAPRLVTSDLVGIPPSHPGPLVLPILGGAVGGALGILGGGLIGLALYEEDSRDSFEFADDLDGIVAVATGALIGEVLVLPLGVHLGNGRRGSYLHDLGISVLSGLGGLAVMAVTDGSTAGVLVGVSLHLGCVVAQERVTARRRAESADAGGR